MADVFIHEQYLTDIADAIRSKLDTEDTYKPSEMADAIDSISGGGGSTLGTKTITQNGTYDAEDDSLDGYSEVSVNVANSYSAGDEGKVVSNGALVSQSSDTVTANNTYDTTLINSLTVNVSGGITPTGTKQISISQNGTTTEDVTNYASAEISVNVQSAGVSWDDICTGSQPSGEIVINATSGVRGAFMNRYSTNTFSIRANNMTAIPQDFGRGSAYLTAVYFPNATSFTQIQNFMSCTRLKTADVGKVSSIGAQAFASTGLNTLILRRTSITTLGSTNTFSSTPFASGGSGGTIYIPKVLYDHLGDGTSSDYQSASNWSTLHGYGTITWAKIEGSQYEI